MTRPSPQPVEQEQQALQVLVTTLAYAQGIDAVVDALEAFPGITTAGVQLLLQIPQVRGLVRLSPRPGAHAAVQAIHRTNLMRRAAYLVQAGRRLSTAARLDTSAIARALVTERRYLQQHLQISAQRETVAAQVAATARQMARTVPNWDGLLGWYAVIDPITSRECRTAHGSNFDPTHVPAIGFPGAVHGNCRCKAGPPFLGTDRRVERVAPDHEPKKHAARRVPLRA